MPDHVQTDPAACTRTWLQTCTGQCNRLTTCFKIVLSRTIVTNQQHVYFLCSIVYNVFLFVCSALIWNPICSWTVNEERGGVLYASEFTICMCLMSISVIVFVFKYIKNYRYCPVAMCSLYLSHNTFHNICPLTSCVCYFTPSDKSLLSLRSEICFQSQHAPVSATAWACCLAISGLLPAWVFKPT